MEQTSQNSWKCDAKGSAAIIYDIASQLYPICRSITGNGVRASLDILGRHVPLTVHEVATGTQVFDWTVPREWNIRDAYVKDPTGRKVIDFRRSNLEVVSYSVPVAYCFSSARSSPTPSSPQRAGARSRSWPEAT